MYSMIVAHQLQEKEVLLKDLTVQISGGIFKTNDPLVIKAQNMVVDMYKAQYAIVVNAACNYPEAVLDGGLYVDNFILFDSVPRIISLTEYVVLYSGPGNLIVNRFNSSLYVEFPSQVAVMGILAIED